MKITEKKMQEDIEKYISTLRIFLRRHKGKRIINLGKPNEAHLRTYIKNWYEIKLLFPETMDFNILLNRKKIEEFIQNYHKNKEKIIKKAVKKLNKTPRFIIK